MAIQILNSSFKHYSDKEFSMIRALTAKSRLIRDPDSSEGISLGFFINFFSQTIDMKVLNSLSRDYEPIQDFLSHATDT